MNGTSRHYLIIGSGILVIALVAVAVWAPGMTGKHRDPTPTATARASTVAPRTSENVRIAAANLLMQRYGLSRMHDWKVRVHAAGPRCEMLLVQVGVILNDSMAESMHYGVGSYLVYDGGVQRYYMERGFRGVAYRDTSGKSWAFGSLSEKDANVLIPCP